jgi:hypothetical protein
MTFVVVSPPPNNPRVEDAQAPRYLLASVRLPNVVELPVVAIVIYTMEEVTEFVDGSPPPNKPRVGEEHDERFFLAVARLPKEVAFPVVAIVM